MKCTWHLCTNEVKGRKGKKFCSIRCKNKFHTTLFRRNIKKKAIEYMGGKCFFCGYDKCEGALHFHHIDPNEKDFGVSAKGTTKTWKSVKEELNKCQLVCSNCHAEIHDAM